MVETINLVAERREGTGKKYARKFRKEGSIPVIYYSRDKESTPLVVSEKTLTHLVNVEHTLINLEYDGKKHNCLLQDVQLDPVTSKVIHADFLGIRLTEKVHVQVPIVLEGTSIGVRDGGGVLQRILMELDILCLPADIPPHFEIDVSDLEVGDSIHVSDLSFEGIEIITDLDRTIISVIASRVSMDLEAAELEAAEAAEIEEEAEIEEGIEEGEEEGEGEGEGEGKAESEKD